MQVSITAKRLPAWSGDGAGWCPELERLESPTPSRLALALILQILATPKLSVFWSLSRVPHSVAVCCVRTARLIPTSYIVRGCLPCRTRYNVGFEKKTLPGTEVCVLPFGVLLLAID